VRGAGALIARRCGERSPTRALGRTARVAEIAAEFVRLPVDVMGTHGTAQVAAAQQATSVIPIVSAVMGDLVGTGLVASLAHAQTQEALTSFEPVTDLVNEWHSDL
jgi:ABC-type uncharacterized transport system substrate-binding protein